jgi:hypothetical protein
MMKGKAVRAVGWIGVLLVAGSAQAEGWDVMYLANQGGTRLMQVKPSQATQVDAFVMADGYLLGVDCQNLRISQEGEPFLGDAIRVELAFDGGPPVALGTMDYAGGAYSMEMPPMIRELFFAENRVEFRAPDDDLTVMFSMKGFRKAWEKMGCEGMQIDELN